MHGLSFDSSLPVVATSSFMAGERAVSAGEALDWRAMGMTEIDLLVWYQAGLVRPADSKPVATTDPDELTESELEKLTAPEGIVPMGAVLSPGGEKRTLVIDGAPTEFIAGPTINVATPEQQRRGKRR